MTRILKIDAGVRYWEDTKINGEFDIEDVSENIPPKMPCAKFIEGEWRWCPEIDAETGKILNWEQGKSADVHYKVCDDCKIDYVKDGAVVCNNDGYFYCPSFLCPKEDGYGDYIIMDIDENGQIKDWNVEDVKEWVNEQAKKNNKTMTDKEIFNLAEKTKKEKYCKKYLRDSTEKPYECDIDCTFSYEGFNCEDEYETAFLDGFKAAMEYISRSNRTII